MSPQADLVRKVLDQFRLSIVAGIAPGNPMEFKTGEAVEYFKFAAENDWTFVLTDDGELTAKPPT